MSSIAATAGKLPSMMLAYSAMRGMRVSKKSDLRSASISVFSCLIANFVAFRIERFVSICHRRSGSRLLPKTRRSGLACNTSGAAANSKAGVPAFRPAMVFSQAVFREESYPRAFRRLRMRVAGPEMRRAEPSNEILYYWHEHGRPLEIVGFDLKRTVRNIQSVGHLRIGRFWHRALTESRSAHNASGGHFASKSIAPSLRAAQFAAVRISFGTIAAEGPSSCL